MIPGVHEGDFLFDAYEELVRQRELNAIPGQVGCPRPHQNLFVEGSRCYCGARV